MDWFVYVLLNEAGIAYTGIAKDVSQRVARHNAGKGAKFTRGRGPWRVAHAEGPMSQGDALRRELAIKGDADFKARLKTRQPYGAQFHAVAANLPATAGAYALLLNLDASVAIRLPRRAELILGPGLYVYCGSARGPGGLRARVGRHFRRDKPVRWHIDQLTTAGTVIGAWVFSDRTECDLMARLAGLPVPLPGFGSSDCATCMSHLVQVPAGAELPFAEAPVPP